MEIHKGILLNMIIVQIIGNIMKIQLLQFSIFIYLTIWKELTFEARGVGF
jgi:hypothetical protein